MGAKGKSWKKLEKKMGWKQEGAAALGGDPKKI